MRLGVHSSSFGVGGCISDPGDARAVAVVEVSGLVAGVVDSLVTGRWRGSSRSGCGGGDEERSDERGNQRREEHHCA